MRKNTEKVLIIDDDIDFVDIVAETITNAEPNLEVMKAYTGKQALEIINNTSLDLIITDLLLTDMNGCEICLYVKSEQSLSNIPIIVVTGIGDDKKIKIELLEVGIEAFITKPFGSSELIAHLRALLRLKSAEDQLRLERDRLREEVAYKEQVLNDNKVRTELILNNIIEGIWDWNMKKNTVFISKKSKALLGYCENELTDIEIKKFFELICPLDRKRFKKEVEEYLAHETPIFSSEMRMCHKDGAHRWFLFRGYAVWDEDDKPERFLGVQSDITESKEMLEQLQQVALYDHVTMLPNRVLYYNLSEKEMLASRRTGNKVGFVFIDLDSFKEVNDEHGHQMGDKLLAALGKRLGNSLRPLDIVARFGGDEFVLTLPDITSLEHITSVITRLRRKVKESLRIEDLSFSVEFSAGVSIYPDEGDNIDDLLKLADARMYEDKRKRKGKNFSR